MAINGSLDPAGEREWSSARPAQGQSPTPFLAQELGLRWVKEQFSGQG